MGSAASGHVPRGPSTQFVIPQATSKKGGLRTAADAPGLFHDTPSPRPEGAFAITDALALQRIQRRASSIRLDITGADPDNTSARVALKKVRAFVWGTPAHHGQVLFFEYTDAPEFVCKPSDKQLPQSVRVHREEYTVPAYRVRLPPGYTIKKKGPRSCYKHRGDKDKRCSRCGKSDKNHRLENWRAIANENGIIRCVKGATVGVVVKDSGSENNERIARVTITRELVRHEGITRDIVKRLDVEHEGNIRLTYSTWGQDIPCAVSSAPGRNGTFAIHPDYTLQWQPSMRIEAGTWSCVCGKGARVLVTSETDTSSILRCGTVVGFAASDGLYTVRLDNSNDTVHVDLRPDTMLPEARPEYEAGKRLMVLHPARLESAQPWVDVEVVQYLGPKHGSRHRLRLVPEGQEVEVDLNRFNHTLQRLSSVQQFLRVRQEYCQKLVRTRSKVRDAMTGRWLDVQKQTTNIGTADIAATAGAEKTSESKVSEVQPRSMKDLVGPLTASRSADRSRGVCRAQSTVIRAAAGTGKTWGMQQVEFFIAQQGDTSFEALPLIINGQELSDLVGNSRAATSVGGASLVKTFVARNFSGGRRTMILQSFALQAVVLLFDGIDEVLELKDPLQAFFADELLAKRLPFVVTSRPTGIDKIDRFGGGCQALDLLPLTEEQMMFAMDQQMEGDEFFFHLLAFKALRKAQDALYYDKLAPTSATRKRVEALGGDLDRFRLPGGGFDPEMRQKTLDGQWLRDVRGIGGTNRAEKYVSRTIVSANFKLLPLFARLDSLVRNPAIPDGSALEAKVRRLDAGLFGSGDPKNDSTFTSEQKTIFRVAKRLVKYHRRVLSEAKEATGTTTAELWAQIAQRTDHLLRVAEHFQVAFKMSILKTVGDKIEVHFAPLKDPVRANEKAMDNYADRFDAGVSPLACIVDVLRCTVEVTHVEEISGVIDNLGVEFEHDGHWFRLELIRAKNKFSPYMLTPSHDRNILLNVRLVRLDTPGSVGAATGPFVFGEVQIKVKSIVNLMHVHDYLTHYEYFRSLLEGNAELLDKLLNRLFYFIDEVCRVPVLISLLIVAMGNKRDVLPNTHDRVSKSVDPPPATMTGESIAKVPVNRNELYDVAIQKLLKKWDPIQAAGTCQALINIARHNVSKQKIQRVFEEKRDVQAALTDDYERACWSILRKTPVARMPLIKLTEKSAMDCKYQFNHLSLQEHLAGAGFMSALHAGTTGRSWAGAHEYIRRSQSQPLCNGVVLSCLTDGSLKVCADDLLRSCKKAKVGMDELLVLRALTTQCVFPTSGTLNLGGCDWVTDTEVLAWARVGSHVEHINVVGTQLKARGLLKLFECCREITELHVSQEMEEHVPWDRLAELCDGIKRVKIDLTLDRMRSIKKKCVKGWSIPQQKGRPWKMIIGKVKINLQGKHIGGPTYKGRKALAMALAKCPNLHTLNFSVNKLGPEDAVTLTPALRKLTVLKTLNLSTNNLGAKGIATLTPALRQLTRLKSLVLSNNNFGPEGADSLASALQPLTGLTTLKLAGNNFGAEGAASLVPALRLLTSLKTLELHRNHLGAEGAATLTPALQQLTKLKKLYLQFNNLGPEGADALSPALQEMAQLRELNVSY